MKNDLRVLRARKRISQESLARAVGVSRQTINAIEQDKQQPSLSLALKIARQFEVNIEEVFFLQKEGEGE